MSVRSYKECSAVLTGSSGGIALEIACQLAEAGVARIMLNGRTPETGREAVERLKRRAPDTDVRFVAADMTNPADVARLMDETERAFGGFDILVNSISGEKAPGIFEKTNPQQIETAIFSHLGSVMFSCQAAMPKLIARGGGVIINIASDAGKIATPGEAIIGGCKAGVMMFSRTLALEASRHGIRVHCLTPSIVRETNAYERVMADEFSRKLFQKAEAKALLGAVTPSDIAPVAVFLCGPGASKITGQAISINGGISAA